MAPNQTGELAWLQVIFDRAVVGMAVYTELLTV